MTEGCVFCDHERLREADLYFENDFCIYASTRDPRDPPDVIPGCGGIVPKVHRASPFDLTAEEWAATRELLLLVRAALHERLAPDGYTLGWNDQGGLHPHLHIIPRFDDEPMADHGVRSGIKDPANQRADPWRPGTGRHMARTLLQLEDGFLDVALSRGGIGVLGSDDVEALLLEDSERGDVVAGRAGVQRPRGY
jgi:diadenosine tetraphosphate (Ap4A) HIT family hydrolase